MQCQSHKIGPRRPPAQNYTLFKCTIISPVRVSWGLPRAFKYPSKGNLGICWAAREAYGQNRGVGVSDRDPGC